MCRMCEGFSLEDDVLALDAAMIAEYGYIVTAVGSEKDPEQWAYTVGLLDLVGHAELIIAGPECESGGALLNDVGRAIRKGGTFGPGDTFRSRWGPVRIGAVHSVQYELDTFAAWHGLRAYGALVVQELEAVQVFAPSTWFCECHQLVQPDLSDPVARVGEPAPQPNRAARRARRR